MAAKKKTAKKAAKKLTKTVAKKTASKRSVKSKAGKARSSGTRSKAGVEPTTPGPAKRKNARKA